MRAADHGDGRAGAFPGGLINNGMLTSPPDPTLGAAMIEKVLERTPDASYTFRLAQMTRRAWAVALSPERAGGVLVERAIA